MLNKIVSEKLLRCVGQVGFFPANSVGDDIQVYGKDCWPREEIKATFYGIRQQVNFSLLNFASKHYNRFTLTIKSYGFDSHLLGNPKINPETRRKVHLMGRAIL